MLELGPKTNKTVAYITNDVRKVSFLKNCVLKYGLSLGD